MVKSDNRMRFKRHELKYYLNNTQLEGLIHKLSFLLPLDRHSKTNRSYKVRSLYFDSIDDECLYEKQSGILQRKKVRLRTYDDRSMAKFEIKRKNGQLVRKDSVTVDIEDAKQICAGNYGLLLKYEDPILNEIYTIFSMSTYKPKVIVEYDRVAFVMPVSNVRITFDLNLRSNINNLNLFSNVEGLMPVILEGKQVMEVKFDEFVPEYLRKILATVSSERMAISKYTLARRFHKIHKWEDN